MRIEKAYWHTNGDRITFSVPLTKIDHARRTVAGFATLDNIDQHGDIITAECAAEAFVKFRGNLREMHQPIAVGKVLSFSQEPYYDGETQQFYNGIYVTAYISEGAQDTWTKVVDGTLTGFSVGGAVAEDGAEVIFDPKVQKTIRIVNKMNLFELSLVDNPANQLANILTLQKVDGNIVASGLAVDVATENILWCPSCKYAKTDTAESSSCIHCDQQMENIGWLEPGPGAVEKVKLAVADKIGQLKDSSGELPEIEGGADMSEEIIKDAAVDEVVEVDETNVAVEEAVAEEVEKALDNEEVAEPQFDIAKALEDIRSFVSSELTSVSETVTKSAAEAIRDSVAELKESFETYKTSLTDEFNKLREELGGLNEATEGVAKRLESVEKMTATKKSGDLGGEPEVKKSVWGGTFLGVDTLV